MQDLRGVHLQMVWRHVPHRVDSPMDYLARHLRDHKLWLETQEKNGALFLSGANAAADRSDGSGTAIIRAPYLAAAVAIAVTEPLHREGLRTNTVRGWLLSEGTVRLTISLFTDKFTLG